MQVGSGEQSVKWLGLAACQRFQNVRPQGQLRGRERYKIGAGFLLPGEVRAVSSTGEDRVLVPGAKLREAMQEGDAVVVMLAASFDSSRDVRLAIKTDSMPVLSDFASKVSARLFPIPSSTAPAEFHTCD
jgi:hypothetical protein